ncbi:hypothetical protein HNQ99_002986 [Rhizorhapis suberifaciens]|uniref:Uncharacterized protein n=1 Tax=Rhizorhapis suberifaciens TaxID=13656 RepID=A0A840HYK8_9SPHN|nr:hypothetical protein [Rhizorhapis suberifaciens]
MREGNILQRSPPFDAYVSFLDWIQMIGSQLWKLIRTGEKIHP